MFTLFVFLLFSAPACLRTRAGLQAEILALRHQLLVLQRSNNGHRVRLRATDRLMWVWLSRLWTGWRSALIIVKPETVIAWHRQGFRLYWRWKSRISEGRPSVSCEVRDLIGRMSLANPRWGAPRIHGELLKLGIQVSQATVAKYMVRHRKPPSQRWRTFLKNHMQTLVSADFFVVPTITFRLLFVFVILWHNRRRPLHLAVTANPTAEWRATAGSFPLGQWAPLSASRSRRLLRIGIPRSDRVAGHPRSPHGSAIAVAKSLCRAPDRHDSPRVLGPRHRPA